MTREDWRRAYEPLPPALEARVAGTLRRLDATQKPAGVRRRTALVVILGALALAGAAYAVLGSYTADIFGWFYGPDKKAELLAGDIAPSGQQVTLGRVVYTLDDAVYKDGTVYGTGTIRAADGDNVVLMPVDYSVHDPAGFLVYYGEETIPDDAPTYAELAARRGATLLLATCVANGVLDANGALNASEVGFTQLPQPDGSIRFTFEFAGGGEQNGEALARTIERQPSYRLSLYIANWEVTLDGEWLREPPHDTWLKQDWVVTVTPAVKGEGE